MSHADCCRRQYEKNKDRYKLKAAEWAKANPEKRKVIRRKDELKRLYGISFEDYEAMRIQQHDLCALCQKPEDRNRNLSVDHDHTTGKVRGLLCGSCNAALGLFDDDPDVMLRAVSYLGGSRGEA